MSSSLTLMIVAGVLISAGAYLMMERSLTRILVGVLLAGNGVNLLFVIASGEPASAPFIGTEKGRDISDPLPQAMVLTAIVITLGLTAFLLTMAYRSFQLNGHDEVADDVEDRQIVRLAEADLASASFDEDDDSLPSEDDTDPDPAEEGSDEQGQSTDPGEAGPGDAEPDGAATEDDDDDEDDGLGNNGSDDTGGDDDLDPAEPVDPAAEDPHRDDAEEASDQIIGRGEGGTRS